MRMKRKKWTEEEEETLLNAYSSSSTSSSKLNIHVKLKIPTSRQKRLQPIADRVNSLHHLSNPSSYPFLWSWRDVAIKIHNMRHQFLNVKQKLILSSSSSSNSINNSFDSDRALVLWPNFLLYKQVFGDIDLDPTKIHPSTTTNQMDSYDDLEEEENGDVSDDFKKRKRKRREWWWREREKREVEEMEWMERMVMMQVEHEKQAMQMHADACHAHLHILGILVRVLCQFVRPSSEADGGLPLPTQVVENSQHPQQHERVEEEEQGSGELANG